MRTVRVGNVMLGEGMPKICVPVTGKNAAEILDGALRANAAKADICEWRADFFEALLDENEVACMLAKLRKTLDGIPVLFTIRTAGEGGQIAISPEDYARVNRCAAQNGADLIDVEIFMSGAAQVMACVHAAGVPVIASSHDFEKTPENSELCARIRRMREAGADVAKIAVMPQSAQDVLRLLSVTHQAVGDTPVVTMAMGRLGVISRLAGETFGSAMTFGSAGTGSAPGQIDAMTLRAALEAMHGV